MRNQTGADAKRPAPATAQNKTPADPAKDDPLFNKDAGGDKAPAPTGWVPGAGSPGSKSGLSIGPPVPLPEQTSSAEAPTGWAPAPDAPPKYPPNIVAQDQKKPPLLLTDPKTNGFGA